MKLAIPGEDNPDPGIAAPLENRTPELL